MTFKMRAVADLKYFLLLIGLLSALAWLALLIWGQSPYARFLNHDELYETDISQGTIFLIIVVSWNLMLVAMMLPTSLPLLALFQRLTARRPDRLLLMLLLIAGYLSLWTLFGIGIHIGDFILHEVVEQIEWLAVNAWAIGAGIFALAGLYQFTPLKYKCLDKCRSPMSFITKHWRGTDEWKHAFHLGLDHGLFCLGCCWSLMLLMFALGMANLGWMLILGAVMATEKNMPWGRHFSAPLGVVLLILGLIIVFEAVIPF